MRELQTLELDWVSGGCYSASCTHGAPMGLDPGTQEVANTVTENGGSCEAGALIVADSSSDSASSANGEGSLAVVGVAGTAAARARAEAEAAQSTSSASTSTMVYCGNPQTGEYWGAVQYPGN